MSVAMISQQILASFAQTVTELVAVVLLRSPILGMEAESWNS